jgi:hypothetical protein
MDSDEYDGKICLPVNSVIGIDEGFIPVTSCPTVRKYPVI